MSLRLSLCLFVFVAVLAACGGGGGGETLPSQPVQTAASATASPTPSQSTAPNTQDITITAAATSAPLPANGGYTGTISVPPSNANGSVQLSVTSSVTSPSGVAPMAAHHSFGLPAGANVLFWLEVTSPVSITFNGLPGLQIALPPSIGTAGVDFCIATYDGQSWVEPAMGPTAANSGTLSFPGTTTPFTLQANVTYTFALYSVPIATSSPSPSPSPSTTPTATPAAQESPSITQFSVPLPNVSLGALAPGPDGRIWFTAGNGANPDYIGAMTTGGAVSLYPIPSGHLIENGRIVSGPDGNIWFAEQYSHVIGKMTASGQLTEYAVPNNFEPVGIAVGPDNNIWFTLVSSVTGGGGGVAKITTSGAITEYPISGMCAPWGIVSGPDKNLWVTDADCGYVWKVTTGGVATSYTPPISGYGGQNIITGPDGNLWFDETYIYRIARMTTSGVITNFAEPAAPGNPSITGVAVGPDGNIWYGDDGGIGNIVPSTGAMRAFALPGSNPGVGGMTTGPDGNIWLTDADDRTIDRVTP